MPQIYATKWHGSGAEASASRRVGKADRVQFGMSVRFSAA